MRRPPAEPSADTEPSPEDDQDPRRAWLGLVCALGIALVALVAVEILSALAQGLTARAGSLEPGGVRADLLNRIGYPFTNLGPPIALFLILAVALMSLPGLLGRDVSPLVDRLTHVSYLATVVLSVVLSLGSVLGVRYLLNQYSGQNASPPPFIRVGFAAFLVTTLGTAAIALFGSLAAMSLRKRR